MRQRATISNRAIHTVVRKITAAARRITFSRLGMESQFTDPPEAKLTEGVSIDDLFDMAGRAVCGSR